MSPMVHRIGSGLCLTLGLSNLAWLDVVLLPQYFAQPRVAEALAPVDIGHEPSGREDGEGEWVGADSADSVDTPTPPKPPSSPTVEGGYDTSTPTAEREPAKRIVRDAESPTEVQAGLGPETDMTDINRTPTEVVDAGDRRRWRVRFRHGEADLGPRSSGTLRRVLTTYRTAPGDLALDGYADPTGTRAFNLELSRARAETVRRWLVAQGVPRTDIRIEAHGEEVPSGGESLSSFGSLRRVEITWERR